MSKKKYKFKVSAALFACHPKVFDLQNPKPLALGIHDEISTIYPTMPPIALRAAMAWITRRRPYLLSCYVGAPRYGLDGKPKGAVTADEAAYALRRFAERQASSNPGDRYPDFVEAAQ